MLKVQFAYGDMYRLRLINNISEYKGLDNCDVKNFARSSLCVMLANYFMGLHASKICNKDA